MNDEILDIISLLSFFIAIKNLQENEKQSELLEKKLEAQNNDYLEKILLLLQKNMQQNEIIIEQNKKLLERR